MEELGVYSETLRNAASLYYSDANTRSTVSLLPPGLNTPRLSIIMVRSTLLPFLGQSQVFALLDS